MSSMHGRPLNIPSLHPVATGLEVFMYPRPVRRLHRLSLMSTDSTGQCAGLVHGRFHPTPMPSYVHLNFTCNVVLIKRRDVMDTFERAIAAFSRPVDPAIPTGVQQVRREGVRDGWVV